MSFIFSISWKHQRLEKEPSIAIHRHPSPSIPSAHSCHSLMAWCTIPPNVTPWQLEVPTLWFWDPPWGAWLLRWPGSSERRRLRHARRLGRWRAVKRRGIERLKEVDFRIEMFSDIVAIPTKPSHYASQMEVSGFIEFCFLSTSCTVSASLVSVQKRMCVSLFEADWQYEYRITKQDFPILFWKRLFFI